MRPLFEQQVPELIHFGWAHGRYLDFWSFIHILTGSLFGILAYVFAIPLFTTTLCIAGIATLYEMFEILLRVSEDAQNVASDIVLTTGGSVLAQYLIGTLQPTFTTEIFIFTGVSILNITLLYAGWNHYLKKKLLSIKK